MISRLHCSIKVRYRIQLRRPKILSRLSVSRSLVGVIILDVQRLEVCLEVGLVHVVFTGRHRKSRHHDSQVRELCSRCPIPECDNKFSQPGFVVPGISSPCRHKGGGGVGQKFVSPLRSSPLKSFN